MRAMNNKSNSCNSSSNEVLGCSLSSCNYCSKCSLKNYRGRGVVI